MENYIVNNKFVFLKGGCYNILTIIFGIRFFISFLKKKFNPVVGALKGLGRIIINVLSISNRVFIRRTR